MWLRHLRTFQPSLAPPALKTIWVNFPIYISQAIYLIFNGIGNGCNSDQPNSKFDFYTSDNLWSSWSRYNLDTYWKTLDSLLPLKLGLTGLSSSLIFSMQLSILFTYMKICLVFLHLLYQTFTSSTNTVNLRSFSQN